MLVLARKIGESIIVGNNIRVKIVEISSGVVRLGIDAPREISIVRSELHSRVEGENRRSAEVGAGEPLPSEVLGVLRKKSVAPPPVSSGSPASPDSPASHDSPGSLTFPESPASPPAREEEEPDQKP